MALGLTLAMSLGTIPYNVLANGALERSGNTINQAVQSNQQTDATSSATYYKKANWENKIKDKTRWKVEDDQNLVRVGGGDPLQMNDIDYDGMFIDANGRYVIRLVYKEKSQAVSGVWYRALINFGDLDKFIDFDLSYVLGKDGKTQYKFDPVSQFKGRGFDLGLATGDRTNNRANLPINLVLKEGVDLKTLGEQNYIVQMRVANGDYTRIYAYAPKGTSMDYSTYTKTTAVDLVDKLGTLFIKGGKQSDQKNATNQEFFMSEFIANPDKYSDKSNLGIIRTQYMGQTNTIVRETVGDQPIAYTQVFDANLVKYLKADSKGNVAYVNVMTNGRVLSPVTKNVGIPLDKINYSEDNKLAYIVIGTQAFQKDGVKVVTIPQLDQHVMLSGFYITAIDYVVDKGQFENTFSSDKVRKLNYAMMSGWTNPNKDGWVIYEKDYDNDYVVPEGESYLIDTGDDPTGGQIMLQVGGDQAILRKPQGYYNGYVTGDGANDAIEKYANGVYKITLREGATILPGKKLRVYMPYTSSHDKTVNFLEIHNGTKLNEGAATLELKTNRNISMHIYKPDNGSYKLKFTLKDGNPGEIEFTKGITWKDNDKNRIIKGIPNRALLSTGGYFELDTTKLKPGADIIVESYDRSGNKIDSETSWFKYVPLTKSQDNIKLLTWVDHSDKKSVLSINKSLYTPYQLLFTNDYAEGTDDFYTNPRVLPADNTKFNTDTTSFVGYTKYDGGKVRTLYEEGKVGKLYAKVEADENEYDDKGNLVGKDVSKKITIPKSNIFDAQFAEDSKEYKAYEYKVDLTKMLPYHSEDKSAKTLELKKDMKFVSTASDGSSLPSDLYETRVRARVLFDANTGKLADGNDKEVRIVPDNTKFYGEDGYEANGFEGANVEANTGDKFPEAPTLAGKNFLGWVTEAGKTALENKEVVTADAFGKLTKDQIFTNETPVTKHLVVYAIYSEDVAVTFDANEGKFGDGKDTTTVKAESSSVKKPTDPTREGYTFKGWADKKDATAPTDGILDNVTAPKTVYAVWEKTEKTPLELKDPTPVEVKDTKSLTSDEIDKVKKAVVEANKDKGITEADVTVAEDGTVTVTKDGKTGTLTPDKTVKQKEVQNNFNPPKEPVPVDKIGELKPDEIAAIKKAVKDANQDRNFKDDEITVKPDGTVEINQGGKVGTIPADKTVVQKDTILDLNKPTEKVEVKNPANLSQGEKDEVADAVKKANENKITNNADVIVDSKGNVTVTDGTKTGKLEGKDTVKPFTRDGKTLNPPAEKVKVGDKNKLTEFEKQQVRDKVKKVNPDLGLTDADIEVDPNGETRILISDGKYATFQQDDTVEEIKDTDNILKLLAPTRTEVANKDSLTDTEMKAVIAAVKAANDTLNLENNDIKVATDGSVTVVKDGKTGQLAQADTVVEKLKKPILSAAKDGSVRVKPADDNANTLEVKYTPAGSETEITLTATKTNGKWTLPDGTDPAITIDEDTGEITLPANKVKNDAPVKAVAKTDDGTKSDEASINSKDEEAPNAPSVKSNGEGGVTVTPPADEDTNSVTITYKDQDGNDQTLVATKENGEWKLPDGTDASITIDKTTGTVTLPKDKIKAGEKVTATAKDANGNESAAGEATPVDKTHLKAEAAKNNNDAIKNSDKYKSADQTKKDAYDTALDKANTVLNDPNAKQKDVDDALKALKEAEAALDGTAKPADQLNDPAKVAVKDPTNLTDDEKAAIKKAVKDANPTLQDGEIKVNDDGSVTVTKTGEEPKTIDKAKTITTAVKTPELTEVANKANLDETEKGKVKTAVIAANSGLTADKIDVKADGTVVVKDADGKETIIPASSVVKEKAQTPGAELKDPAKVAVKDPTNLTDDEKAAIKKAVKDANPTLQDGEIKVNDDGSVTVTKTGEEPKTIDKAKTITTAVKTPELTEVANKANLDETEKGKVKTAVIAANSGLTADKIDVKADGTVVVKDADGKETIIPASSVVKEKAQTPGAELKDPAKVAVKDPTNLTDDEKAAIKKAVKDANPTLQDGEIKVNDDGSVTVTKTGEEPKTIDKAKTITTAVKTPELTEVANKANLDETEKGKVKTAVIAANSGLTADKIDVKADGTVVVKDADGKETIIPASSVVKEKAQTPGAELKDPAKVAVKDPANLTDDEKAAIKKAVKDANPTLQDGEIKVNDDGSVTVTKTGEEPKTIDKAKTITTAVKTPELTEVANKANLDETEKGKVKTAVIAANSGLTADKIDVKADGTVVVKDADGKETIIPASSVVKEKAQTPGAELKDPAKVAVKDPTNLTDDEKAAIKKAVKDANPTLQDGEIKVNDDGSVTVTKTGEEPKTIDKAKTITTAVKTPELTEVANKANLDETEKGKVKTAVIAANSGLTADKIDVKADGTVVVKDADGKETIIPASSVVKEKAQTPGAELKDPAKVAVKDPANLTDDEKAAIKKAVKDANPTLQDGEIKVNDDGSVTVTKTGEEPKTIDKAKTITTAVKTPELTEVANKANLDETEKGKVKTAVIAANSGLTADKIDVKADGTVVVKDADGKETIIPASSVVKEKAQTPGEDKTTVDDSNKKPVNPTNEVQGTGVVIKNPKGTTVIAKDEDGKNVPVMINPDGEIVVEPGYDVDGPIEVTIKDKNGKVIKILYIDILGHSKGVDDNFNGYPSDGGEYIIPRIRYRDHKTPTHPVYVTVPEKTQAATPVRDTLWYVFHINEFQYEVVRNGVVTKRLMDVTPVLQNGRTMLPLRYVAEALQADVKWDAKTRTATFTKDGLTASIQIDSDEIVLSNGKTVKMDSKPLNINDRILVSVTNVANVFGLTNGNTKDKADQDIEWEQQDKSATIYIRR